MSDQTARTADSMAGGSTVSEGRPRGTVVRLEVPAGGFILEETLETVPDAEFAFENVVESGANAVLPLVWARTPERSAAELEAALADDSSVERASLLTGVDDRRLYRMDWDDRAELLVRITAHSRATLLDLSGTADGWSLDLLYPSRDEVSDSLAFFESHDVSFDVRSIRDVDGDREAGNAPDADGAGTLKNYGLSEKQAAALEVACERGYFEVPREMVMKDLADEVDVSHQALSERLRRGCKSLLENTVMAGSEFESGGS
jgi:hypothetical protein